MEGKVYLRDCYNFFEVICKKLEICKTIDLNSDTESPSVRYKTIEFFNAICQLKAVISAGREIDKTSFGDFFTKTVLDYEEYYRKIEAQNFSDEIINPTVIFETSSYLCHSLYTIAEEGNFNY